MYLTSQTHHSLAKAFRIAGLSDCITREIPLDAAFRMRPDQIERAIQADQRASLLPWLVVASAGSTDTGAIDPLNAVVDVAEAHHLWLHVDGAYGAMFALCAPGKKALSGIERSDSLTLDPHKGLFMPCGSGAVLVRNGHHLHNAYHYDAHYMQDRHSLASLEESRPQSCHPS